MMGLVEARAAVILAMEGPDFHDFHCLLVLSPFRRAILLISDSDHSVSRVLGWPLSPILDAFVGQTINPGYASDQATSRPSAPSVQRTGPTLS